MTDDEPALSACLMQHRDVFLPKGAQNAIFSQRVFLCLSRACLGKIFIAQKGRRFSSFFKATTDLGGEREEGISKTFFCAVFSQL